MPDEINVTLEDDAPVIEVQIIGTGPVGPTGGPGPEGPEGPAGSDGVSPEVTITAIPGGHRVTITDAEHPTGQSFDVMDGEGAVTSVNGQTGTVVLDAEDVGALPDDTPIPAKTSDLTNDSGFITASDAPSQADFDSLSETVEGEVSRFNKSQLVPVAWTPNLTKGAYWKLSDGTSATNNNRYCRTSKSWLGYNSRAAINLANNNYEFVISLYTENEVYIGYVPYAIGISYLPPDAYYYGISIRRIDGENITDADITAIGAALSAYAFTDKTLTQSNYPADAKATGDALAAKIPAPSSPATGAFLVWDGTAWVAQTLSTWQGGSY